MFHGFYNLASGMITQNRNLNVISNNMTNVSTPGFKHEKHITSAFQEEMIYRMGRMNKDDQVPLYLTAMLRTSEETITNYEPGVFEDTGINLDFALTQNGFFVLEDQQGNRFYTRNGSFSMDSEGYLCLPGVGRVLGEGGPIKLETDQIFADSSGNIYNVMEKEYEEDGETDEEDEELEAIDKLLVVDFPDYGQLRRLGNGSFSAAGEGTPVENSIRWKAVERSNVDPVREMTNMISTQRSFQSSAQMLKMYDQLMGRIVTEVGRL